MVRSNFFVFSIKIFTEFIGDILFFPLWWYTRGLKLAVIGLGNFIRDRERAICLTVWVKNLFRPMYQQRDIAGVLISFFMRLIQIIARGIAMVFVIAAAAAFFCFYLALPALVLYGLAVQLSIGI